MSSLSSASASATAPLGAVLDTLLHADDAEFSQTVGSDAPDLTTPTAATISRVGAAASPLAQRQSARARRRVDAAGQPAPGRASRLPSTAAAAKLARPSSPSRQAASAAHVSAPCVGCASK